MATLYANIGAVGLLFTTTCTFSGATEARHAPPRNTYETGKGLPRQIRIDASTPERGDAIENAVAVTVAILSSEEFQALLKAERLRRGPEEKAATIGPEVAEVLSNNLPQSVTILERRQGFWGFWGLGSTTATTDPSTGVVSLAPFRIDEWMEGRSGLLVNTLAHELTHLDPRYIDGDRKYCHEATLVSYRVGDLAQCLYESRGDRADQEDCATTITNGVPDRAERLAGCREVAD